MLLATSVRFVKGYVAAMEAEFLSNIEAPGTWTLDDDEAHTLLRKTASKRQYLASLAFAPETNGYQARSSHEAILAGLQKCSTELHMRYWRESECDIGQTSCNAGATQNQARDHRKQFDKCNPVRKVKKRKRLHYRGGYLLPASLF